MLDFIQTNVSMDAGGASPAAQAAALNFAVAKALAKPTDELPPSEDLAETCSWWNRSNLLAAVAQPGTGLVSDRSRDAVRPDTTASLDALIGGLSALQDNRNATTMPAARVMVAMTALLLAGADTRRQPAVRVPVVFGRPLSNGGDIGLAGFLELRVFPAGPVGLYPDPRDMAGVQADPSFAESILRSWQLASGRSERRCVLWRIMLTDQAALPDTIGGGSFGAAMALGLRELFRYPTSRRPGFATLRGAFYRLQPKAAVTGVLERDGRLSCVSHLEAKLGAAETMRWLLIAPEANKNGDLNQLADLRQIRFAKTLPQASRYAYKWRTGRALASISLLLSAMAIGVTVNRYDTDAARRASTASALADASSRLLGSDLDLAQFFAAEAYSYEKDPQTKAALFNAATSSPALVRYLSAGSQVTAIGASPDGSIIIAGTATGQVIRWSSDGSLKVVVQKLPAPVLDVSTDDTGDVISYSDESEAGFWTAQAGNRTFPGPLGSYPSVAVSPSGRFVATTSANPPQTSIVTADSAVLIDTRTARSSTVSLAVAGAGILLPSDQRLVVYGPEGWEYYSLGNSTNELTSNGQLMGAHGEMPTASANGGFFGYTNGGSTIPVWSMSSVVPTFSPPDLVGLSHGNSPQALAISDSGRTVAVADAGTIYLSDTGPTTPGAQPQVALTGNAEINPGGLMFLGDDAHLLSATGSSIALWDTDQVSRISTRENLIVAHGCEACAPPLVSISPSGRAVAVLNGTTSAITVRGLGDSTSQAVITANTLSGYRLLGWSTDGSRLFITDPDGELETYDADGRPLAASGLSGPADGSTLGMSGEAQVVEETYDGLVQLLDPKDGRVEKIIPAPPGGDAASVQIAPDSDEVAAQTESTTGKFTITLTDLQTEGITAVVPGASSFTLSDQHLVVQTAGTQFDIWNSDGTVHERTIANDASSTADTSNQSLVTAGDIIAQLQSNDTVTITDIGSGQILGTLALPEIAELSKTGLGLDEDGTRLVSVSESGFTTDADGLLTSTDLSPSAWAASDCATAGQNITAADWRKFIGASVPSNLTCTA